MRLKRFCKVLGFILIFTGVPDAAQACRFIPDTRPLAEKITSYETVFTGKIIKAEINESTGDHKATIAVQNVIKGTVAKDGPVAINSSAKSCSLRFQEGQIWLIASEDTAEPFNTHMAQASFLIEDENGDSAGGWEEIKALLSDPALEAPIKQDE